MKSPGVQGMRLQVLNAKQQKLKSQTVSANLLRSKSQMEVGAQAFENTLEVHESLTAWKYFFEAATT